MDRGRSVKRSVLGTLSDQSALLNISLSLSLSLSRSPGALIPVLVLQCIDTDTDYRTIHISILPAACDTADHENREDDKR